MVVQLLIHLEDAGDHAVWWAESDDVPGFSAAADTLVELRQQALAALEEIARDQGESLTMTERLVAIEARQAAVNPNPPAREEAESVSPAQPVVALVSV